MEWPSVGQRFKYKRAILLGRDDLGSLTDCPFCYSNNNIPTRI